MGLVGLSGGLCVFFFPFFLYFFDFILWVCQVRRMQERRNGSGKESEGEKKQNKGSNGLHV